MGSFGKYHAWRHLKPLMGAAVPHPRTMQAAVRGSKVEVSADLPSSVAPLVMRASGKARGAHFQPWIVTGAACQHPALVLWYKQPPERRGPSPEVSKTLAEDQELHAIFRGTGDAGAPSKGGVRIKGGVNRQTRRRLRTSLVCGALRPRRRPLLCGSGATWRSGA